MSDMTSNQPYLLRAFYDWIVDNGLTPYVVVNANDKGVDVPREFVQNGQIVLNISPGACVNLHMDIESLSFQARFGGTPRVLSMPCHSISAIYAKENGAGTVFVNESTESFEAQEPLSSEPDQSSLESVDSSDAEHEPQDASKRPKGRPSLKVIK